MASEMGSSSSSQDVTPVPVIALAQSQNELLLPPNNCPNCKVLSRHLKISREWNNFFRLKLDQRDMLLHVAADYKRQKQRCLQLQMSLDQQSRECGEMRDQLTSLLLEVNPLKERVQIAEQAAKEELLRREKAESNEYNLRFLNEQQAHKIKSFEKFNPNLLEILERKLSLLRAEVKRLKQDSLYKSRVEWELKQEASLAHAKQQRILKKAHWGLSLAHKYGSCLLSQGQLLEGESSQEWVRLKSVLEEVESGLHKQYLALCQHVPVRPLKEAWLDDFDEEWQKGEGGGEDNGAKQLEKLIQDTSGDIISEEEEEEISEKKIEESFGEGNQQYCNRSDGISKYEETALVESEPVSDDKILCLGTQRKKNLPEVLKTSILATPAENSVRDSVHISHNTVDEASSHRVDRGGSKDGKVLTKSTSILDISAEDNESDPIPSTGCSKDGKVLTKSTSVLDTSAEDNENNSIPRDHDSVDETTPDASNTGKDINNHVILASTVDITTKDIESGPLNSAGEAGHHTSDRVVIMDTPEPTKQRSILDTSTEDSDEEIFPRSQDSKTLVSQSLEMKIMKDTMELSKSTAFLDTSLKNSEKDCNSGSDEPAPSVTSYHLDEELQAILRNMRPHEKLEDMDASSSHSSEGPGYVVKRDVHDPYMKQNLLASLSDSEEEEQKMDAHNAKDENGDEMSMPPRILTTQMSEGFSVASSHRDSSLHDDLDLSTDTLNPDDEKEEEKEIQKRVSLLHFPSTQSFSCDMEEGVPPPSSVQSPVLLSEEAEEDDDPKRQQISFQPQLQKTVDKDDKNTGPITDTLKTQNKVSLREFREMFEAVDDSSTSDERGPVDTKDKERYIEEEEEENSEDIERKLMKVVWKKTMEPQKQQKTGAVKGKNTKTVEEYTVETLEETLENVNEATVGKVERTETEEERIVEAETQRASVAEEQKNSRDKEERNLEDGKESITELEKERTSGTEEERTIGAKEEKNRKAEEGRTTDGVEERTTVVKEKDVEAMIKESTDYVGKIPCQGQERMSETVEDIPIEEEERTVPAVLEKNIKMMEERTNSEEERITDAVKGSTIVVVEKLPYAEDRATEIVKERATYTREESHTDFVGEKNYDAVRKGTTENVEKMISETAEHKTTIDAESILVNAQERTTKVLKEKNTDPVDARTTEDKTVFAVEKKCTNKGRISEAIQERIISTLEKNYNNEENNTEAIEDITTFVMEEIHIDKESSIKVAEERNSDTLEQEATDAVGDKKTENRTADADEERIIDAVEDRSTIAVEEKASETAEEKTYEAMGNKNIAVVEERTMEAVTERKSSFVEGKNSKAIGERTHITVEERTTQIVEGRPFRVMEEISTDVKQKIAEAVEEKNSDMEESAIAEEESDVRSEEGSALSTKRMMRKVLNLTQQKGKKEGGGTDDQEASCWKRRLRRQRRFEWESEAVKQEKKGRNLGGCVVRRLVAKGKLEEANKANIQAEMERRNTLKEMEDMEMRTKKMKVEEKNTSQQREGGRKQEEKVMEEESKKQEEEGKIIKQGDLRKEEEKRGKKKNEGKIKKSETEVGKKKQEKENEIKMKKKKRTLDGNVMKQVEEEVSDEREEKGRQHEEKNNQKEEAKLKEIEENRRKETEMKKEKGKEKRNHEEKGKQRNQENERQKQEEKRMQEKRKSIQEEKKQEQEKRGKEEGKSCTHEVEEKSKFELNQKEGEKRMKEEENQNKSICKGENTKKTQGRGLFWGERFADTNKGQERIIFSWSLKRTERRKLTKFNKLGKLMRVIPDPLGSQRHSVYTMECRIQPNEEQQGNRKCKKTEQPEVLQGTREGQVMYCKDGNIGKEKSFRKTNTSVLERVRGGMMNESEEDQINKENKKKCTAEEDTVKNEKALKIRRRRERNSSSSSNEEMTLCSSRELQSRNRTQQLITHPRNTTVSSSGNKVSHTRGIRQLKAKASKVSLFGLDSSSSSEVEEEKTEVKQNRKCKEKEQQQLQSLAHSRSKYCRLSMPFGSLVSEKKKAIEQVQVNRTRELSSSSSWSYSTSPVTNDSEEESITEKRGLKQPCWSQENHSDTSSESDFLQHSLTRKCKALLIVSDSDHQDDSSSTAIFQRKGRRKRKVSMSDSILIEESDCSSDSDSDHSSSGQKRHVAHHITPMFPSAHARTQTEMPRKVDTELCTDTYPQPSATLGVTPYILQRKSSTVSPGKQEKDSMPDEKRYEVEPRKCTGHHTVPEKQQNKREGIPQTDHKPNTNRESPLTLQSLNQNARKLGYGQQIMKGRARTLRKVRSAKKTTSTPSHTSKRKHSVLLLETSPQSYKRQKGSSSSVMEHKVDSSNTSDITLEPVGMDSQEEDTLILPKMKSGSFMLMAKEKYAHPQSKIVTQVLLDSSDQDQNSSLMEPESEKESELVIEENLDNCTDTSTSNLSSPCTQVTSLKTQEGLVQRVSHLGPVVFIDRPRLKPKPAPAPKVAPQTPVPAGPEYVDRLFSKLNQRTGVCSELNQISEISSLDPTQDIHSKQSTRNASLEAEGASSQSQSHPTHHSREVDYQGQCSILLPNIYGTLGPAPTPVTSASPRHGPNFSLVHSEPTTCQPHQPTSSHISSTSEQAKASQISSMLGHSHPMPDYPHTTLDSPHPTHGQLQSTPTQPHSTPLKPSPTLDRPQPIPGHPHHTHVQPTLVSSHPYSKPGHSHPTPGQPHSTADYPIPSQPSQCSLPEPHLQSWLPEIITERVIHCGKKNQKRHPPTAIEYLKETLEEVVASRVQSRWWVMGLRKICAAITNTTLPSFLRLVLESILRSDPLEPQQHYDSLPPRLFRLFQVVCVVEQRLTPQHPNRLRSALLRAVQAIVTQSDIMIRPQSLASLSAWYVASASIDSQHEAGQEWGRGRAFLVDLLFHHPGTAHLAILTAANTCRRLFLRHVHYRGLSGLEQVLVWLAHYGAWVGRPGVRSDLTKWLAQHLNSKKPPQSPATLAKNLVTLLEPGNSKDRQWGAVVGLVVLTRWQGRPWAQKHLLPALSAATAKITTSISQEEDPGRGDLVLCEDLRNKNSHLFGNLGRALPCGLEESQTGE